MFKWTNKVLILLTDTVYHCAAVMWRARSAKKGVHRSSRLCLAVRVEVTVEQAEYGVEAVQGMRAPTMLTSMFWALCPLVCACTTDKTSIVRGTYFRGRINARVGD